jgi:hypothetical protein
VWERDTIAAAEVVVASAEEGDCRGALLGLKRAWPTSVGCGHCRTEAEEEGVAAGEEDGTTGAAAEGEMAASWEESIAERRISVLVYLGL